ncbi:hypothetical protein EYC80_004255 [Monilinia laxa]|uniref:Uncharacterized protein n=1 Tax=Monilinia laxa TaxID=61186 RepID=A0A5N6KMT2_MONLA|nr:hypothetical protein EYC80_004255 [Monilinia laxa]
MMAALTTPPRGSLTDASFRINRQRKQIVNQKSNFQYLSTDSFTTPDCAQFKLDYSSSSTPSSQSPYNILRRDTSTGALRSLARYQQTRVDRGPYDTTPHTPCKLSKAAITEYELIMKDDFNITAPLTMPIRLSLNKKLPPMPIFRLANSPERRGLLDATDLNSSFLQFPTLQPNTNLQEFFADQNKQAIPEDLNFVATTSITHNSEADSDFELGVADIETTYDASTNLVSKPTDENMVSLSVRDNKSSRLRKKSTQAKLASASNSGQSTHFHLTVPEATDRRVPPTTVQENGSPLPRNRHARSSVSNAEASLCADDVFSPHPTIDDNHLPEQVNNDDNGSEPLIQLSTIEDNLTGFPETLDEALSLAEADTLSEATSVLETTPLLETTPVLEATPLTETDILTEAPQAEDEEGVIQVGNQNIVGSLGGQIQSHSAGQEDVTEGAIDSNLHSLAHGNPIVRSESQATLARMERMSVAPPKKHFARDADVTILGRTASYDKVSARTYIKGSTGKVEQPRTGRTTKKISVSRRKSSLPDSPENQALKPPVLTVEKRPLPVERFTKPTVSSAARAKSGPLKKSGTMASVKSAGKGLKKRLSTIIRTRRASQVVATAASSAVVENGISTAVLDTAPELAPFAEELDVGEEFALVYSQMNNSSENVVSSGQLVNSAELVPMPEPEMAVVLRLAAATPLPSILTNGTEESSLAEDSNNLPSLPQGSANVEDESENIQPADVEVAAGDGASDPPPNENGNSGHADEQAPQAPVYSQLPSETHQEVFNRMQASLSLLLDAVHHETNPAVQTILYHMAEDLTNRIGTINNNSRAILYLQQAENNMVFAATLHQEHIERTLRNMGIQLNAGNN